ncbi:hypothetical protein XHC_0267 [Xanthomonas hortorum pv. carotae str. M081]|nr:hypothetical protein XHC_0267 [Xanthomonas hortorum pv. carotae str. M081]
MQPVGQRFGNASSRFDRACGVVASHPDSLRLAYNVSPWTNPTGPLCSAPGHTISHR